MTSTAIFEEQVRQGWGSASKVADAAFDELFRHGGEISLDHDDQVAYAMQVGLLAAMMKDSTPEEFISAFNEKVLNQ